MTFKKYILLISLTIIFINIFPSFVIAENPPASGVPYQMLAKDTPLSGAGNNTDINTFLPAVFKLGIGIASALAVIFIIVGGIQYLSTDSIDKKDDGKKRINNALFGLILAISAYTILYTINPKLVNLDLKIETLPQGTALSTDGIRTADEIDPIGASGCSSCAPMPDQSTIPHKGPGAGCSSPGPCVLAAPLMHKLTLLNTAAKKLNPQITWQVTEMFPPTVLHADSCHNNGTCADATITAPTTNKIIQFLTIMEANGITNYAYEKCPQEEANKLIIQLASTKFGSHVKCYKTTTGESLHMEQ